MISARISENSCNKEEFNNAAPFYNKALSESGYSETITYVEAKPKKKRSRKRNIIWYNPPYSSNVKNNIGKEFFKLLDKHFPKHHKYHKLFNRNNVKLSYSCMPNMEATIRSHNSKLLKAPAEQAERTCNCPKNKACPLAGNCLQQCLIYKATVTSANKVTSYIGACEPEFKTRLNNHTKSFKKRKYETETELSKYIWKLKDENEQFEIAWEMIATASPYKCGTRHCNLCLTEKLLIMKAAPNSLLNSRNEIVSKCRHSNKFKLGKI